MPIAALLNKPNITTWSMSKQCNFQGLQCAAFESS